MNEVETESAVRIVRRLAAIGFADVVGWTRLIERDDVKAALAWKSIRTALIEPQMAAFGGRIIEVAGDAVLVEFGSAVDAVRWAIDLQARLAQRRALDSANAIQMRIGISVEDVIVDGTKLLGDGVNVAARVHQMAAPDEVIITQSVHEFIRNKLPVQLHDLGERQLKNISRPVRIFRVVSGPANNSNAPVQPHLMWENRPTVAVLPFRSEGPLANPYFGDGITEEIITALSMNRSMFVIARNSTLRYRGEQPATAEVAAELGVRYLLVGSVRRIGHRLRINAELVDAGINRAIWTERYDGVDEDLFTFQGQIAACIAAAIGGPVEEAEMARVRNRPTESFSAYDCVLRGVALEYEFEAQAFMAAGDAFRRAIELDPYYAQAHAHLAWWHNLRRGEGRSDDPDGDLRLADHHAQRAVQLDPRDAWALSIAAHILSFQHRQFAAAMELFDEALHLNPNCAVAWARSATTLAYLGRGEEALVRVKNAMRLSPFDQQRFAFCTTNGTASIVAGRYDEAVGWLVQAHRLNPGYRAAWRMLIAALALSGDPTEAARVAREFLVVEPTFSVTSFGAWYPLQAPHLERVLEGLRMAGLPA